MLKLGFILLLNFFITSSLVLESNHSVGSRQFLPKKERWYDYGDKQINYQIDDAFSQQEKDYIKAQFNKLTYNTCLKTSDVGSKDVDSYFLRVLKRSSTSSCEPDLWSNDIHLSDECIKKKWGLHAIMHALGFAHEHQRPDRNCYVTVREDSVLDPDFVIDPEIEITFPYDVHSIMHYRRSDKLKPASDAWNQEEEFGQWDELTEMDTIYLNHVFCGGKHYCDIDWVRCQYFRCWIECKPCYDIPISQCESCTVND